GHLGVSDGHAVARSTRALRTLEGCSQTVPAMVRKWRFHAGFRDYVPRCRQRVPDVEKFGFDRTLLTKWWASSPIARGASRRRASLAIGGAKMEDHHDARAEESDSSQGWLTGTRQAARQRVAGMQGDGI